MTACSITDAASWLEEAEAMQAENLRADTLAMAAREGDESAFRTLVELFQTRLHRFCWRWLNCEEEARDTAQETFVKAWFALDRYEPRGRFGPWLFRIAINLCRDKAKSRAGRQRQRTVSLEVAPAQFVSCEERDPAESSAHQGDLEKLHEALALLPEKLRLPLLLCGMEGMSQKDAAMVIGCSVRAIEGRVKRGKELLEAFFSTLVGVPLSSGGRDTFAGS